MKWFSFRSKPAPIKLIFSSELKTGAGIVRKYAIFEITSAKAMHYRMSGMIFCSSSELYFHLLLILFGYTFGLLRLS